MPDLVVIACPSAEAAFAARAAFAAHQRDCLVEMEDVVVVTRSEAGDVHLHQAVGATAGGLDAGPAGGTPWGALASLLFHDPLLGRPAADLGVDDDVLRATGGHLDRGGAALAILLRRVAAADVADRLRTLGGTLVQASLPPDVEARLLARAEAPPASPAPPGEALAPALAGAPAPGLAGAPAAAPGAAAATPPGESGAHVQP